MSDESIRTGKIKRKVTVKNEAKAKKSRIMPLKKVKKEVDPDAPSECIKLSRIPFGFFEREILKYFKQFGTVRRVRVPRNKKTANFKGYAYVQFTDPTVAQIAAETMNGYLMFNKIVLCNVLKNSEVPKCLTTNGVIVNRPIKGFSARKNALIANKIKTEAKVKRAQERLIKHLQKTNEKLVNLGIDYSFTINVENAELKNDEKKCAKMSSKTQSALVPTSSSANNSEIADGKKDGGIDSSSETKPEIDRDKKKGGKALIKEKLKKTQRKLDGGKVKSAATAAASKCSLAKRKVKKVKHEAVSNCG